MSLQSGTVFFEPGVNITAMLLRIQSLCTEDTASARHWADKLSSLMRDAEQTARQTPQAVNGGLAPWHIRRLQQHVEANIERPIRLEAAAALVRLSRSHFSRCFKNSFGEPFGSYMQRKRIGQAQRLMVSTRESLSQIAVTCGFADQAHFTRSFNRHVGQTPNVWRRGASNLAMADG
jgi:transcriptional regulator GlxA family with amidase domain